MYHTSIYRWFIWHIPGTCTTLFLKMGDGADSSIKSWQEKNPESRKFLKSWKSLGGGGGAKFIYLITTSISLFISSFHFNFLHGVEKSGERGDSVFKHVNLRKSVCYDEKWVGVGGRPRPLMLRACILHVIQYMHEISLNEIKRSLSFYKMQNYIQRPTCRTFFSKSVLNYRCHSYAHSFSPHDQTVDLVCHPSLHM